MWRLRKWLSVKNRFYFHKKLHHRQDLKSASANFAMFYTMNFRYPRIQDVNWTYILRRSEYVLCTFNLRPNFRGVKLSDESCSIATKRVTKSFEPKFFFLWNISSLEFQNELVKPLLPSITLPRSSCYKNNLTIYFLTHLSGTTI